MQRWEIQVPGVSYILWVVTPPAFLQRVRHFSAADHLKYLPHDSGTYFDDPFPNDVADGDINVNTLQPLHLRADNEYFNNMAAPKAPRLP